MTGVKQFLRARRKAELQTIHQFWFPGEARITRREDLEKRVLHALVEGANLQERIARLTQTQRAFLGVILQTPEFQIPSLTLYREDRRSGGR